MIFGDVRERDFEDVGNVVYININKIKGWFSIVLFGGIGEKYMWDYFGVSGGWMIFRVYGVVCMFFI